MSRNKVNENFITLVACSPDLPTEICYIIMDFLRVITLYNFELAKMDWKFSLGLPPDGSIPLDSRILRIITT